MGLMFQGNWSFSWLMKYESCPMMLKLGKIDRLPQKPLPPDNPMERGNRCHKNLEDFVAGKAKVLTTEPKHIDKFRAPLEHLRHLFDAGMATTEEDWLYDRDWNVCDRSTVWLWAKLDASVWDPNNNHALAIDYKTGKSTYKSVEHIQQLQLYAAITALRFPDAHKITTELWYLDESELNGPHVKHAEYTRDQALSFVGRFDARAQRMYDDRFMRANPNKQTCRYCPYGPQNGTGACPVGV